MLSHESDQTILCHASSSRALIRLTNSLHLPITVRGRLRDATPTEKFLVGKDGKVIDRYGSATTPGSLEKDIEKALNAPASAA